MRLSKKTYWIFVIAVIMIVFLNSHSSYAASTPYQVETVVKNNWSDTYGSKSFSMSTGKQLVYDVYSRKYTSGGYDIVNRNFGNGYQPYINFQGWAVIAGHKRHTTSNNDTYIVAQKVGSSTTKIYSTLQINISATEDLEYNSQGSGVWNECPSYATNRSNLDCNMRYNGVGFNAFLPIEELFPSISDGSEWRLFIVKKVDNHIVYSPLILPFSFDNRNYNGGEISLSSGVNANTLIMSGSRVLRRSYPLQTPTSVYNELGSDRYFTTGRAYTRVDSDESRTAIQYGVRSPHDNNRKKWAATAYWIFGGSQAVLKFVPDDKPPIHIADSLWSHMYQNGNDYWTQPNDTVYIRLKQRDVDSGNKYQYLRLDGSGVDVRSRHSFKEADGNHWDFMTSSHVNISTPNRTENTDYGAVNWSVIPKTHQHNYNILYYYRDMANNSVGYNDTGMNLRVDGVAPEHVSNSVYGARFVNGNDYWIQPNDNVNITLRQRDTDSGNKHQYLRLYGSGVDVRSQHAFYSDSRHNNDWMKDPNASIISAQREENTDYGRVKWTVTGKTHGQTYNIQYYFRDNVDNTRGYVNTGKRLRIDGIAPSVSFSPQSQGWTEGSIKVNTTINDSNSGVKRFRYRTQNGTQWSNYSDWIYADSHIFNITDIGRNRIHVQSEDNVGNINNVYSGYYYINNPPIAKFEYTPEIVYEGDTITLTNKSIDPDGHNMTAKWEIVNPNGTLKTYSSWDVTITNVMPGNYQVKLIVTDEPGGTDAITKTIGVNPLKILAEVNHTYKWKSIHEQLGNDLNQFFSGERFMLNAALTNHPVESVEVTFSGNQIKGKPVILETNLNKYDIINDNQLYNGSIYEEFMSSPETKLKEGSAKFIFKATWKNGTVKIDTITVQIIDDVYNAFNFYRSS